MIKVFALVMLAAATPAFAQPVRILTAGAFLGQLDGLSEYPAGPFDADAKDGLKPYGGVAGVKDWLDDHRSDPRPDLFLLTGNNQPHDFGRALNGDADAAAIVERFWKMIHELSPTVVGLGSEDFLRALTVDRNAGRLTKWLREDSAFLASNVAVRLHAEHLNRVESNGFSLRIDETSSIGWLKELPITLPCDKVGVRARVTQIRSGDSKMQQPVDARIVVDPRINGRVCGARLVMTAPLPPAGEFQFEIRVLDATEATFTFSTDEWLTNRPVFTPREAHLPLVVSMVDPQVRKILPNKKWEWHAGDKMGPCRAETCEIVMQPAIQAFDQVLTLERENRDNRPVALISALTDTDTLALLQHSARIRFVVFPPESSALGRAADRAASTRGGAERALNSASGSAQPKPQQFSGDLGYGAVLNPDTYAATQIWSRPEWLGETVHTITATVKTTSWEVSAAKHTFEYVPGRTMCAETSPADHGKVHYYLVRLKDGYSVDRSFSINGDNTFRYPEAVPDIPYDKARRIAQGALWTDVDSFAAMTLNAMRTGMNSELALIPADDIDDNQLLYLRNDDRAPRQALSKVILERVLYRAGTIVRVHVPASSLIDTINRVLTAGRAVNQSYCLGGFGTTGCNTRTLDKYHTLVNGRDLDRNRIYTIAMPERVALERGFTATDSAGKDLIDMVNDQFATTADGVINGCTADFKSAPANSVSGLELVLPTQIERLYASRRTTHLYIKPAEFSWANTTVGEPPDGQDLFSKLPIPNNGAKNSQRYATNVGMDWAVIDAPRWTLRGVGSVSYGYAKVLSSTSIDPNLVMGGLRVDWKLLNLPHQLSGVLFAGPFIETQIGDTVTQVQATRRVTGLPDPANPGSTLPPVSVAGPTLPLVTARREYDYFGAGFELARPQVSQRVSIDPLRATLSFGTSQHEHVDVTINGQPQGLAAFQQFGAAGLLSRYYQTHLTTLTSDTPYAFVDQALTRHRVQIDATPHVQWSVAGRTMDFGVAGSYRRYFGPNLVPLAESQSLNLKATLAVPFYQLATFNISASSYLVQVNNISGWFSVWTPSISVSIPIIIARHAGWTL